MFGVRLSKSWSPARQGPTHSIFEVASVSSAQSTADSTGQSEELPAPCEVEVLPFEFGEAGADSYTSSLH